MNAAFDREFALGELLPPPLLDRLGTAVAAALDAPCAVVDAGGEPAWGDAAALGTSAARYPLAGELEPLAYFATAAPAAGAAGAARLLDEYLALRRRYLMASFLHTETTSADYAELQRRNEALAASETRYRELSEQLEERVQVQAAELDERQRQLYQAERLASVAQLAAGVAHEMNNPLGFVRSNLTTLGKYLSKVAALKARLDDAPAGWHELDLDFVVEDGADLLKDCIDGIDRAARIVADLKGFSNVDRPEEAMADINDGLRAACAVIESKRPPGVALVLDTGELPLLLCLPGHLNQVFLNILTNALQAVGDAGEIRVESRCEAHDGDQMIVVRIRDNGIGIEARDLAKVFDPFYTTRPVGQGTGLGLTVARDIVQVHNGTLTLDSAPGQGTLATIRLPL